jgi:hypothetical protein
MAIDEVYLCKDCKFSKMDFFHTVNTLGGRVGVKGFISRFLYKKVRNYWITKTIKKYGSINAILSFPLGHPVREFRKFVTENEVG